MPKITKRTVEALHPEGRERVVWDDGIKGFGVPRASLGEEGVHRQVQASRPRREDHDRTARSADARGRPGPVPQRLSPRRGPAEILEHMAATVRRPRR